MLDEGAQQLLVVANGVSDQLRLHHQIVKLERCEVGQGITLGIAPDQFDRIELRSIRRQQVGTYIAAMIGKPTGDGFETMGAQTVPDQGERYAQRTTQYFEEGQDRLAIVIGIGLEPEIAAYPMPVRRDDQGADDRDLTPRAATLPQSGGVAARRPTVPTQWPHQEPGFVDEDDRRAAMAGVFFTCGQVSCAQRWIAASSRSTAWRAGSCGLQPKSCNSRPT
jgi:hypothetical protein